VFYCNDGAGCIAHGNVCDGIKDCRDGSDECMCNDVVHCTFNNDGSYCVPRRSYCNQDHRKLYKDCKPEAPVECSDVISTKNTNSFEECYADFWQMINPYVLSSNASQDWCMRRCEKRYSHFCPLMADPQYYGFALLCNETGGDFSFVKLYQICDGINDCGGGADEKNCPGRYYCGNGSDGNSWIDQSEVCNNKKDCPRGDDECQDCVGNVTSVANDRDMIQSKELRAYMVIGFIMISTLISLLLMRSLKSSQSPERARLIS